MVGREVLFSLEKEPKEPGEVVLSVERLQAVNDKGLAALRGVSIEVRSGEIVGLAGIAGNGQSELAEVITALRPATGGRVCLHGRPVLGEGTRGQATPGQVLSLICAGVSHIPEDRTHVGTAPT